MSPLIELNIDMVQQFPLDYMHLVCLGVVRRMAKFWLTGNSLNVKLNAHRIELLSLKLVNCKKYIPCEFARKPRAIKHINLWKATELRQFLLYTGPIILIDTLKEDVLKHFRLLHCAIYILAHPVLHKEYSNYAENLLKLFINSSKDLYGLEFIVMNVHALSHISNDVRMFGPLDAYSAFPFENHLHFIKKHLRSPNKPLQQLIKRIGEGKTFRKPRIEKKLMLKKFTNTIGPDFPPNVRSFRKLHTSKFVITTSNGDNCFQLDSGETVLVKGIFENEGREIFVCASICKFVRDLFDYPLESSKLGIFVGRQSSQTNNYPYYRLARKCLLVPKENLFSIIPLLHDA